MLNVLKYTFNVKMMNLFFLTNNICFSSSDTWFANVTLFKYLDEGSSWLATDDRTTITGDLGLLGLE